MTSPVLARSGSRLAGLLRRLPVLSAALLMTTPVLAQTRYAIDVPAREDPPRRGHLDLGGSAPGGDILAVNNQYLEWNGRPFFPVVGEIHYARYPREDWEHALRKLRAGGINVAATYVFWNLHERREGEFDWSGNLDLREFVRAADRVGLHVIVRIGPFCHGEIRNGGLPDWLYGRDFEIRSNDPAYLARVERLYGEIAAQVQGLRFSDGGPIIGVQLENEYQHSAAPWELTYPGAPREYTVAERDVRVTLPGVGASDRENAFAAEGRAHLAKLKEIAQRQGLQVPLYTATGWGNAAIVERGSVPVTAAYPYPFWAPPSPSPLYLYKDLRRQPDYAPISYEPTDYPSLPAEIGPGIMPTYHRRPRVEPESVPPLILRMLGSGSNGIGYYMYHGGSTPVFEHFFSEEAGGLPKISYDFQAPIGEFGQLRPHFHTLRQLHLFLGSYGARLAPMLTTLPETNAAITPEDVETLRYAVRAEADGSSGFVFMHNFQDHQTLRELEDLQLVVRTPRGEHRFPSRGTFSLKPGAWAILPFGLEVGGLQLDSATVQPLTVLHAEGAAHHVFVSLDGFAPELLFAGSPAISGAAVDVATINGQTRVTGPAGEMFRFRAGGGWVVVLPAEQAREAWLDHERGRLWFSSSAVLPADNDLQILADDRADVTLATYPSLPHEPEVTGARLARVPARGEDLSAFRLTFAPEPPPFAAEAIGTRKVRLHATGPWGDRHEVTARIDYVGDRCMAFIRGRLVADHFYQGDPWELGLRKFRRELETEDLILVFHPVRRDHAFLADLPESRRPQFADGEESLLRLRGITFATQRSATLRVRPRP